MGRWGANPLQGISHFQLCVVQRVRSACEEGRNATNLKPEMRVTFLGQGSHPYIGITRRERLECA